MMMMIYVLINLLMKNNAHHYVVDDGDGNGDGDFNVIVGVVWCNMYEYCFFFQNGHRRAHEVRLFVCI